MNQEQALTSAIAFAAVNNQDEMVAILSRNGVIVPTETLTLKMLIELIVNALAESQSFQNDFYAWIESQQGAFNNLAGPAMADGAFVSQPSKAPKVKGEGNGAWLQAALEVGKALFSGIQSRQQITAAEALREAEANRLEAERIRVEGSGNTFAQQIALGRLSTTRVIVFGLIGVAVIGTAIYFFTRKKA